jgi:hypothetical protein
MRYSSRYSLAAFTAALVLAGAPSSGFAQGGCERELKTPEAGEWAEYEATIEGERTMIRYARLPKEAEGGNVWIEMSVNKGKKAKDGVIYQALVPGFPFQVEQVQELVFKAGESKATKPGPMMMRVIGSGLQKSGGLKTSEVCSGVTLVGNKRETVPGGTFSTRHYKNDQEQFETWVSSETPFGLVKAKGRRYEMVLNRSGKDAKSSITETPEETP